MTARGAATAFALVIAAGIAASTALAAGRSGADTFAANCAYCHGASGAGDGPNAAKLKPRPADLTRSRSSSEQIGAVIRNGRRACPSWKASLSEDEIKAVTDWTKSLQK